MNVSREWQERLAVVLLAALTCAAAATVALLMEWPHYPPITGD